MDYYDVIKKMIDGKQPLTSEEINIIKKETYFLAPDGELSNKLQKIIEKNQKYEPLTEGDLKALKSIARLISNQHRDNADDEAYGNSNPHFGGLV